MSLSARRAWIEMLRTPHHRNTRPIPSLSARRAWIEMLAPRLTDMSAAVALRKESVDRNGAGSVRGMSCSRSLSARRAWIEMAELRVF